MSPMRNVAECICGAPAAALPGCRLSQRLAGAGSELSRHGPVHRSGRSRHAPAEHDDFAAELADRYMVMERGEIVQEGRAADVEADGVRGLMAI